MKKQHYVPRFYLENWAIPDTYQVNVYDTVKQAIRISSITDVACENYFYDLSCFETIEDKQFIEKFFSNSIEPDFSLLLKKIVTRVSNMNQWEKEKCYFLLEKEKAELSVYLAWQFIRTKTTRNAILETSSCLQQILNDIGVSDEVRQEYDVSQEDLKHIHAKMIFDYENIINTATRMVSLSWLLLENKTDQLFFTSDSPIGTQGHIKNDYISTSGIQSEGIEIFFPLSPNMMLVMYDGDYHKYVIPFERRIIECDDTEIVRYYNSLCVARCNRFVFSIQNDFSIINEMLEDNPNLFKSKYVSATFNGKTYTAK